MTATRTSSFSSDRETDPELGLRNILSLAIVAAALAVLGYLALATYWRQQPVALPVPQAALDLQKAALKALPAAEREAAVAAQRARLSADPLDREAILNLSLLKAASGEDAAAETLAIAAASRSLRDVRTQVSAVEILLKRGEIAKALTAIDGLIRSRPQLQDGLFDQIVALSRTREGEPHVIALLASDPPWRTALIERIVAKSEDRQLAYRLLSALNTSNSPPADVEVRLLLGRMAKDNQYATAYYVWLDQLDDGDLRRVAGVFDSGFDATPRNLYFDWTLTRSKTAEVKIVPRAAGSADKVLRIDYVGNRERVIPALQYLRLEPGNYVLSGEQRADNLKTDSGINWRIVCLEGNSMDMVQSPKLQGSSQWSRFDVRFAVPPGCTTQQLHLGAATTAVLDQQLSGTAQFDNLAVTPLAANP